MTSTMIRKCWTAAVALAALTATGAAPSAGPISPASADEVTEWHENMLATLVAAGTNPIVSTRDAALVSAAVFDAVNGIERRYEPILVPAEAPRGASKRAAAVQAAYVILVTRYPAQAENLAARRTASLEAIADGGNSLAQGVAWGQDVAEAILEWRSTDGFTPAPPAFVGGSDPGQWRPTPPANAAGLLPQWATMSPWGMDSADQFRPAGPPALDSDLYLLDFNEVKEMGLLGSALRTDEETDFCRFWQMSTPTFLWNRVALDLIANTDNSLSDNAHLLATMNLSIADAIISCWDAKYHYEFWRPITAIRLADTDGNDDTSAEATWTPLLVTPPFPEHTSGHSSASSAATTVLADFFGDETSFTVRSHTNLEWVRSFTSFSSAIEEVADARVFAGIHFRTACDLGAIAGTEVASYILENMMARLHGNGD